MHRSADVCVVDHRSITVMRETMQSARLWTAKRSRGARNDITWSTHGPIRSDCAGPADARELIQPGIGYLLVADVIAAKEDGGTRLTSSSSGDARIPGI